MCVWGYQWTPSASQVAPLKDAYVSVGGVLGDPLTNFSDEESLYVGESFDGVCVAAIAFDLSSVEDTLSSLAFNTDITVYGSGTWTVKVNVIYDISWTELGVTGISNPFNATSTYVNDYTNLTTLTVTGSTEALTISLGSLLAHSTFTLVFAPTVLIDGQWITMSSRENPYLYSFSNPPHLDFTLSTTSTTTGTNTGTSTPTGSEGIPGYSILLLSVSIVASISILSRIIHRKR